MSIIILIGIGLAITISIVSNTYERATIEHRQELERNVEMCNLLSDGVKNQWNNIIGVTYNELWDECWVTYINKDGKVEDAPLSSMQNI